MLKWIAGGAAAFFAGRYLLRLQKASQTIVTRTSIKVNRVGLSGIELKASVKLQNPNPVALAIQFPFLNLIHKDVSIGSSTVKNETIQLSENSEKTFDMAIQSAGWLTLIQVLGADIVQKIRSGQKVSIDLLATTSTQINGIPYEQQESIKLTI
ncbi:MAG: hypothetical protein CMP48_17550 [Rickettsiales bacterium]|jgi:LEA14-like dessication related protein|nr:hypothetical protein [Rickettsiales bacterium]